MLNPDIYHGELPWNKFEGWYFKISSSNDSFGLIPGISNNKNDPHSFLQIIDGTNKSFNYFRKDINSFKNSTNSFILSVEGIEFSEKGIYGELSSDLFTLTINLKIKNAIKWNPHSSSHRSMGFYNFIPFMQCYSQVCFLHADVTGYIIYNNEKRSFNNASAYSEKNWGNSFPNAWYWIQCNNFEIPGTSLTVSAGDVPMLFGSFKGFLAAFSHNNKFYKFTTINGSKFEVDRLNGNIVMRIYNSQYILYIETFCNKNDFILLHAPDKNGYMKPKVLESISSEIKVKLVEKNSGNVIFENIGINSGIEFGGYYAFYTE